MNSDKSVGIYGWIRESVICIDGMVITRYLSEPWPLL